VASLASPSIGLRGGSLPPIRRLFWRLRRALERLGFLVQRASAIVE
jgi:hypothetical protein